MKLETIRVQIPPLNGLCPYCCGTGKLKAMQSAMTFNGKSVRVQDTTVKCNQCNGRDIQKVNSSTIPNYSVIPKG